MDSDQKRHLTFPLRLPFSLRDKACELAHQDGISLNHFISLAVAEKISRIEQDSGSTYHQHPEVNRRAGIHPVHPTTSDAAALEDRAWRAQEPRIQRAAR